LSTLWLLYTYSPYLSLLLHHQGIFVVENVFELMKQLWRELTQKIRLDVIIISNLVYYYVILYNMVKKALEENINELMLNLAL
jgi:hypothetical protein